MKKEDIIEVIDCTPSWSALITPMLDIIKQGTDTKSPYPTDMEAVIQSFKSMAAGADKWNAHVKAIKSNEDIKCPHCGGTDTRAFDMMPLHFSDLYEISKGMPRLDRELTVSFACDSETCGKDFSLDFKLVKK